MSRSEVLAGAADARDVRYRDSRRVTVTGMAVNASLAAAQVLAGVLGHSQALVADGIHTLSDLFTDFLVLFGAKKGAKAADAEHPYGHARIETLTSLALSLVLIGVGFAIAVSTSLRMTGETAPPAPSPVTLVVALIALIAKESLYRYVLRAARRLRSALLETNAWHYRSDAFSSIIVAVGIAGSLIGFRHLDALAAIGVAAIIGKIGGNLGWGAVRELIDTGLSDAEIARVREVILGTDGVKALHLLRTRQTGGLALIDVHILVDGTISVSEGHQISEAVRQRLMREIEGVTDVMVHIDPEDDERAAPSAGLPLREAALARLRGYFNDIPEAAAIEDIDLHYLDGRLYVELLLPLRLAASRRAAQRIAERFRAAAGADAQIARVDVRFH